MRITKKRTRIYKLTDNTTVGHNCHTNGLEVTGKGKVYIGDNFHSGKDILIITENHNYMHPEKELPYDCNNETNIQKPVTIERNVWLGSRVIVLSGTHIEEGVVAQAGSVLHGRIPRCSVVGGNPAQVLWYRDIEHYNKISELMRLDNG